MLEELRNAKHYIFLEYFIIADGYMWNSILDILKDKASRGLDVRLIYDDVGCISLLPNNYPKTLESYGIKCIKFNPFRPVLSSVANNRDHRKIMVIDGHTGFTGGINLADEYINRIERFGHWKDDGIMLKGDAVWNLTEMFLSTWNALRRTEWDFLSDMSSDNPDILMKFLLCHKVTVIFVLMVTHHLMMNQLPKMCIYP